MLRSAPRPKPDPSPIITINPFTRAARVPPDPANESVYALVYGDPPAPPAYKSRHAARVREEAKKSSAGGLGGSLQRLETCDTSTGGGGGLRTVPATTTGLYATPRDAGRTGSVKRVPPAMPPNSKTVGGAGKSKLVPRPSPTTTTRTPPTKTTRTAPPPRTTTMGRKAGLAPSSSTTSLSRKGGQHPPVVPPHNIKPTRASSNAPKLRVSSRSQPDHVAVAVEADHDEERQRQQNKDKLELDDAQHQLRRYEHEYEQRHQSRSPSPPPSPQAGESGITASGPSVPRLLTTAERVEILASLKIHWEKLSAAYRRLPIASDSPSKLRRKNELEYELQIIEDDMKKFSGTNVLVMD
ncbi:hypothetical protein DFJ77DRAFT_93060 [Powellomyces hirtus]|nr:hypothetical protein DFJ77DRAFT_93060 [Powellomyces hirtus]